MHALGPLLYVELKDSRHSSNDQGGKKHKLLKKTGLDMFWGIFEI